MPLYVKNDDVDKLAEKLATLRNQTKTEVVRQALLNELQREQGPESLVERGLAFGRALRARADKSRAAVADKAFIDSLYGD